jgi:hypothetical protein
MPAGLGRMSPVGARRRIDGESKPATNAALYGICARQPGPGEGAEQGG